MLELDPPGGISRYRTSEGGYSIIRFVPRIWQRTFAMTCTDLRQLLHKHKSTTLSHHNAATWSRARISSEASYVRYVPPAQVLVVGGSQMQVWENRWRVPQAVPMAFLMPVISDTALNHQQFDRQMYRMVS